MSRSVLVYNSNKDDLGKKKKRFAYVTSVNGRGRASFKKKHLINYPL